jgi:hypothetical protein
MLLSATSCTVHPICIRISPILKVVRVGGRRLMGRKVGFDDSTTNAIAVSQTRQGRICPINALPKRVRRVYSVGRSVDRRAYGKAPLHVVYNQYQQPASHHQAHIHKQVPVHIMAEESIRSQYFKRRIMWFSAVYQRPEPAQKRSPAADASKQPATVYRGLWQQRRRADPDNP